MEVDLDLQVSEQEEKVLLDPEGSMYLDLYKEPAGGSEPVEVVSVPRAELPLASHFHWDRSVAKDG